MLPLVYCPASGAICQAKTIIFPPLCKLLQTASSRRDRVDAADPSCVLVYAARRATLKTSGAYPAD